MKQKHFSKFSRISVLLALISILPAGQVASADETLTGAGLCITTEEQSQPSGTVYFANASAVLDRKARSILNSIASKLSSAEVLKMEVTGFVSAAGSPKAYKSLSQARAINVQNYLIARGIEVEYITKGVGLAPSQSSAALARKATVTAVVKVTVPTGGTIPQVRSLLAVPASFEQNKAVNLKVVELDSKSSADTANPVTFTISPSLPSGLSFNARTGVISGSAKVASTPTAYLVTASNNCGSSTVRTQVGISAAPVETATVVETPTVVIFVPTPPAPPANRTISIDSNSFQEIYFDLLGEDYEEGSDLERWLADFNGSGVLREDHHDSYTVVMSPTLTSTPSAGGGIKHYFATTPGVCRVNELSGRVSFLAPGDCSVYVRIDATASHNAATSPTITITLARNCAEIEPLINPSFEMYEGKIRVTSGSYYVECEIKSYSLANWGYAKGALASDEYSDYAFTGSLDYIIQSEFSNPDGNGANAQVTNETLSLWKFIRGHVIVTFEDGSSSQYLADNFNAYDAFGLSTPS